MASHTHTHTRSENIHSISLSLSVSLSLSLSLTHSVPLSHSPTLSGCAVVRRGASSDWILQIKLSVGGGGGIYSPLLVRSL